MKLNFCSVEELLTRHNCTILLILALGKKNNNKKKYRMMKSYERNHKPKEGQE